MMAAVAKFRDDVAGNITTGGTSTAYTVTSNQVITANTNGMQVAFQPHVDCGAAPTLSVDSQTAKPLRPYHSTDFVAGELKTGAIYTATYNTANSEWIVEGYFTSGYFNSTNSPDLSAIEALAGTTGALRKTAANTWSLDDGTTNIAFSRNNNGTVLPTGVAGDMHIPFACTITGATLLADQSGSIVVDLWKLGYSSYPPTVSNTITASALPTLSSATKYQDTTLTGWTTAVSANDVIRVNINSVSSITRFLLTLKVKRFI